MFLFRSSFSFLTFVCSCFFLPPTLPSPLSPFFFFFFVLFCQEHITQRLLPVRDRMIAQLAQRSLLSGGESSGSSGNNSSTPTSAAVTTMPPKVSDTPTIDGNLTALGGGVAVGGGEDDATAVSDGWMGSACSSSPCGVIAAAGAAAAAATAAAASSATCGNGQGVTNGGMLAAASMPRPCSSLSLGDLCGDQEGDDGCGGVFLVGGDCDDVNGSGIGLDLYDLGQVCWWGGVSCFVSLVYVDVSYEYAYVFTPVHL